MTKTWVKLVAPCGLLILAVAAIIVWCRPRTPKVTFYVIGTALLDKNRRHATFVVNNEGRRPAFINFEAFDAKSADGWRPLFPKNISLPLGMFGSCLVPGMSNSTVMVQVPVGSTNTAWRVHASVFLPLTTAQKGQIALRHFWGRAVGRSGTATLWPPSGYDWAYRICSQEITNGFERAALSNDVPLLPSVPGGPAGWHPEQ